MPGYVDFPYGDDPAAVIARLLDAMRVAMPGWTPNESAPEVVLAEEIGRELADLRELVVNVSGAIVTKLGNTVFNVPVLPGAYASAPATITTSQPGQLVPAGFLFIGTTADGDEVALQVMADAIAGEDSTTVAVTLQASDMGHYANGIPAGELRPAYASNTVLTGRLEAMTTGGVNPETEAAYRDRLVATLSTLTRTPVLPADYAVRARDVLGVQRALALDGYVPATGATGAERTITLVPVDAAGLPVPTETATAVRALLNSLREVNFQVFVIAPSYTTLAVQFSAVAKHGADPAVVQAAMVARGRELLSPATWAGGDDEPPAWTLQPMVRRNLVLAELASVEGCAYISALTLNGSTADATLTGVAPLPAPTDAGDAATLGVAPTTVAGTVVGA